MKLTDIFSPTKIAQSLREIFSRFFQAAVISILLTIYIIDKIITESTQMAGEEDAIFRMITTLVLSFFLSLGITLFYENQSKKFLDRKFPLLPIVYGVIFYFTVKFGQNYSLQGFTYFLLHLTGFISFAFFLPYVLRLFSMKEKERDAQDIEYSNYFSSVSWTFLMSGIVGLSLVLLGVIAISSVVSLFELSSIIDEEKYYGTWVALSLAFLAPMYGLREFPRVADIEKRQFEINRFFSFLIRYIATPAAYIYFIILYAYSVKVLLNFSDWPKGIVSWLVIGFSSFGYLTYIFSKPYEGHSSIILYFRKAFPYAVIPQLAMLFYAIGLRISQYDLTMNRYFVVAFGIWLLTTSIYFILRRSPLLAFVPASLALVSFVISIGPWGVFSYPFSRQESRLIENLQKANILQNDVIVPLKSERDITKELSTDIASGIEYLCRFDDCKRIKELFPDQLKTIEEKSKKDWEGWNKENTGAVYPGVSYWEVESGIMSAIKVARYQYDDIKQNFPEQKYLYYNVDYQASQYPLKVDGYDLMVQVIGSSDTKYQNINQKYPYVTLNADTMIASYVTASGSATAFQVTLSEKLLDSATLSNVSPSDLTFRVKNDALEIEIMLQSLTIKNPRYIPSDDSNADTTTYVGSSNGFALVKYLK